MYYIWVRMFITKKAEETAVEEWIDFPALEAMLAKIDKEDKNTSLQVSSTRRSSCLISIFVLLSLFTDARCFDCLSTLRRRS